MSKCLLCNSNHRDPRCGEFIRKGKIVVHEFCLYLSSALLTNGDGDNGLYGFLPEDIIIESKRASELDCVYCRKPYASIGCCHKKCRHSFHALCGIENGCENQFAGTFQSYCKNHIHKYLRKRPPSTESCCICYDSLLQPGQPFFYVDYIEAPCCHNGWFHRTCLQGFAKSAGYFFKCPLCNDTQKFKNEMPYRGIFVPERDAAWELEPNAFSELLERPTKCEIEHCKNKRGRNAAEDPRDPLLYCETCGAVAAHQNCLPQGKIDFICQECANVTERAANNEDSGRESLPPIRNEHEDDESEEVDVCTISDSDDDDFLEKAFIRRNKPPIISDSSDMEHACKTLRDSKDFNKAPILSRSPNSVEKRFRYDSSDESDDSEDIRFIRPEMRKQAKLNRIEETDESFEYITNAKTQNTNLVIDSSDETSSSERIFTKRKKIATLVIDSTDEDSDESFSDCLATKRRRTKLNDECSEENVIRKTTRNTPNARKILTPLFDKNVANTNSYQDFSAILNSNGPGPNHNSENRANVSCIANRTRRRKSDGLNVKTPDNKYRATEKQRTSSSSSSQSSSLGYSSTTESSASITSSTASSLPCASTKYRRRTAPQLQKSSSFSSTSSSEGSTDHADFDIKTQDISCIAKRTRHRKS